LKIIFILIILLSIISCREEVIEPNNFVGNVNEPIQINQRNSYTFLVNAQELSMNLSANASFNSASTRITITLRDHKSGYVSIIIRDSQNNERYRHTQTEDVSSYSNAINGFIPNTIHIVAVDFSGKLRIELYDVF
jgi:hypothetical protein